MDSCRLRPLCWAPERSFGESICPFHQVHTETSLLEKRKHLQVAVETGGRALFMSPFCIWGSPQSCAQVVLVPLVGVV